MTFDRRRGGSGDPLRRLTDSELVQAMRDGDPRVLQEFVCRFEPLLYAEARRARIPRDEWGEYALEFLDDAALYLMRRSSRLPVSVAAFLVRCFRRKLSNARRERTRRDLREARASGAAEHQGRSVSGVEPNRWPVDDGVVLELCSAATVRASRGADWDDARLAPALERLASALDEGLTTEERLLLVWVSNYVPHSEIASALGLKVKATSKRIERLRDRLREAALAYAAQLDAEERREVARFFKRAAFLVAEGAGP